MKPAFLRLAKVDSSLSKTLMSTKNILPNRRSFGNINVKKSLENQQIHDHNRDLSLPEKLLFYFLILSLALFWISALEFLGVI